ncbi:MAG: hypothetical protein JNL08_15665 [Planctomycetes bacterium]|nr:hypothetical protein [Planctomycetota bacterium]
MPCPFRAALSVVLCLAAVAAQDFAPSVPAPPAAAELALGPDARLELAGGVLRLHAGGAATPVPCTQASGPGAVRAFARAASGVVYVAAERGLFVLDAGHPVLDPMDLRDGVPPGAPTGLAIDAQDRLWLATEQAFGVVDPRFGFGRTFTAADGLPAGPFGGVALAADGSVLLAARDGTFGYRPDQGPPPQRTGGAAAPSLTATSDGEVALDLRASGRGGATLRQRRRHDHQLRAMDGAVLQGLKPGRHTVEVHAVDRDLRRAVVAVCDVTVPLPPQFRTRFLPVVAFGVLLLLAVGAFGRARPGAALWRRTLRAAGNALLVFVCGLQVLAACLGYGRSWPFVGFSMYTENWHEGSVLYRPELEGLLADGTRVLGAGEQTALLQDGYWQMLAEVVFGGPAAQQALLERWNAHRHAGLPRLHGFRLLDTRIRLTARGPVDVAPNVVVEYRRP